MSAEKLIIFVKAPRPGEVKTRLAQAIGATAAAKAYVTLVARLVHQLANLNEVELRYSPDDAAREIDRWLQPGWMKRPQGDGDLGVRLANAFGDSFGCGIERAVIIGSDCPSVMPSDIESAWHALRENDLVLGPATDGGYWLIGLRRHHPTLFQGISWSTENVLDQTLNQARALGLSWHLLEERSDVDTEADWKAFVAGTPYRLRTG